MNDDECVFCNIVAGTSPARFVYTWPDAVAFVPLDPVNDNHVLVIPRTHVPDAITDPDVSAATMRRAAELASQRPYSNIITSTGEAATQSVFHLHLHVVFRKQGDTLMVPWGTTGDPHEPHWCPVAQHLKDQLDLHVDREGPDMSSTRLRQGHHEERNLWEYPADEDPVSKSGWCVGRVDSEDLAAEIVAAVNKRRNSEASTPQRQHDDQHQP